MNINVTVCEPGNRPDDFERDWQRLADHVRAAASDLEEAERAKQTYPRYVCG